MRRPCVGEGSGRSPRCQSARFKINDQHACAEEMAKIHTTEHRNSLGPLRLPVLDSKGDIDRATSSALWSRRCSDELPRFHENGKGFERGTDKGHELFDPHSCRDVLDFCARSHFQTGPSFTLDSAVGTPTECSEVKGHGP